MDINTKELVPSWLRKDKRCNAIISAIQAGLQRYQDDIDKAVSSALVETISWIVKRYPDIALDDIPEWAIDEILWSINDVGFWITDKDEKTKYAATKFSTKLLSGTFESIKITTDSVVKAVFGDEANDWMANIASNTIFALNPMRLLSWYTMMMYGENFVNYTDEKTQKAISILNEALKNDVPGFAEEVSARIQTASTPRDWNTGDLDSFWKGTNITRAVLNGWQNQINPIKTMNMAFMDCKNMTSFTGEDLWFENSEAILSEIFSSCSTLKSIEFHFREKTYVKDMHQFALNCYKLESVDLYDADTGRLQRMDSAFASCYALNRIAIGHEAPVSGVLTTLYHAFWNCSRLEELDLSNLRTASGADWKGAFYGCKKMRKLNLSGISFDGAAIDEASPGRNTFAMCSSLNSIEFGQGTRDINPQHIHLTWSPLDNKTVTALGRRLKQANPQDDAYIQLSDATKAILSDEARTSITSMGWLIL